MKQDEKIKILFFTPFGTENGAETFFWYLLQNMNRELIDGQLFCNRKGIMIEKYPLPIPVFHSPTSNSTLVRFADNITNRIFNYSIYEHYIENMHKRFNPDVWYINTIVLKHLIPLLKKTKVRFVVHWHELALFLDSLTIDEIDFIVNNAYFSVGCSQVVCDQLLTLGCKNVELQYTFIDFSHVQIEHSKQKRNMIREKLNIPKDSFLWVMAGYRCYRKGVDFIPQIANFLKSVNGHIMWIGRGENEYAFDYMVQKEIETLGLTNVHFTGEIISKYDYYDYMYASDGFLLTSREESLSIVAIEGAKLGKPIVAFNCGGIAEVVKEGMGIVIQSWDLPDLFEAMLKVMNKEYSFIPQNSIERADFFDVKTQIKNWENMISRYFPPMT